MNPFNIALPLTDPTTPLLRRTSLLPNESLASVLERLAQLNFYANSGLIQTISRERLAAMNTEDDLAQPTQLETFQQLANLTHLPLDDLYAASDQRFASWLIPLGQPAQHMPWLDNTTRPRLVRRWARAHLRPSEATQFCPLCLAAAAYHRLSWIPRAAAICLEHLCLLTDHCPRCWKRTTVADLVHRHCLKCRANLRRAPSISIAEDSLGIRSQQVIQTWFNVACPPTDVIEACHLPPQSPHALYHLLHLITHQLLKGQAEWPNLPYPLNGLDRSIAATIQTGRRLAPKQAYLLYRSAFAGLLDWPEGLFRLLDAYGSWEATQAQPPARLKCLHRVQQDWLSSDWRDSPLAFVQCALLDYVLKRNLPLAPRMLERLKDVSWFITRTGLWTEEYTAQYLDLPLADLYRLSRRSSLAECYWPHSSRHLPRFQQAAVLAVKQRWAIGWSLKDASSWLGLEVRDVWRLVELGLLPTSGELNAAAEDQNVFNPLAVRNFFAQVVTRLEPYPESRRDLIPIAQAVDAVDYLGVDLAVLLQSVLTGLVPAYQGEMEMASLDHVYFIHSTIFDLPDRLYATRGLVSGDRFADEYGLAPSLVREWLAAGLIRPTLAFGCYHYFDYQHLKDLAMQSGFVSPAARPMIQDPM